jgi:large subunit ribosomal protein L15
MKLHELQPAEGSRKARTRVGRGIAAGKGKTAGRGTKGQKARAGGSIRPWFEGGQTPLQIRIPKLRGFRNRLKLSYEVVNVGDLSALAEFGALEPGEMGDAGAAGAAGSAPLTISQDILRAVGLVRTLDKPLKILGGGEVTQRLFVIADAFSKTAKAKIEAAGGTAQVLEMPASPLEALGVVTPAMDQGAGPAAEASGPETL